MSYATFEIKGNSVIFNMFPMRSQKLDNKRNDILLACDDAILENTNMDDIEYGSDLIDIGDAE